jgi:hypothetical protein
VIKLAAGTFHWSEDPSTASSYFLPPQKIPLAENRFLQIGKQRELKIQRKKSIALMLFQI